MKAIHDIHFTKNKNAKLCSELRNLPIVSIEEGQEIGVLNSFLVDPAKKRIVGFILTSHETKSGGIKVVPFEAITSFGSFALTISRANSVSEVAANPYFIELFEKDIMLLGAEIRSGAGALLGYVKDVAMDQTDGSLLSLKITSDAGFLSPYFATLPFTAADKLDADQITISPEYTVEFKKDTPFSDDDDKTYVPLVAQELQVKQLIAERLRSEIDRFRGELRERLYEQHEEYFLKRQKPVLEQALNSSLKEWLRDQIASAMEQSERDMTGHIAAAIEAFFESNHLRQLHEHINSNRVEIENLLQADAAKRAELTSQTVDLFNQRLAETESRVSDKTSAAVQDLAARLNSLLDEHISLTGRQQAKSEAASIEAAKSEASTIREETSLLITALESKFNSLENSVEKLSWEYRSSLEALDAQVTSQWSAHKQDFESRTNSSIEKIASEVESLADRFESEKNSSETLYSELRALISDARQRFHADLDARISELSQSQTAAFKREINTSIASAADRYNSQLSERISTLSAELRKNLDSLKDSLASETSAASKKIDSFSEELNEAAARNAKEINDISDIARSAIHAAETASKENAALASDFERSSETLASFNEQIAAFSRNTAEALRQLEDKIQSSESNILEQANNNTADFIEKVLENKLSALPVIDDIENLKTAIAEDIATLENKITGAAASQISAAVSQAENALIEKLTAFIIEKTSLQPFESEIQSLNKQFNADINMLRDEIKNIARAPGDSSPAGEPSVFDPESLAPIIQKLVDQKITAQIDAETISKEVSAQIEKIKSELTGANTGAPQGPAPDTEKILDTIEQWQQALDNRLTPLEDNWDTADQSLADIQRAAESHSDRLDYIDETIIQTNNSLDALNNILRGTENRVARLRDEVFSLGEILKSNLPAAANAQAQTASGSAATPEIESSRIAQLENKLASFEKTLADTNAALAHKPSPADNAAGADLDNEQFDFLERNIAELAEKLHALEKKTDSAQTAPAAKTAAPAVNSLEIESQKQKIKSLEQKVSSFDLILPAVTDFFKDSGIRESVNIIRNAQEKSEKLLPAIQEKLSTLEAAVNTIESSIQEQPAQPRSTETPGASGDAAAAETSSPAELDEIKTRLDSFMNDITTKLDDLNSNIETSENETREHAARLVESMQQQIDIALEDITARMETELTQAVSRQNETPPQETRPDADQAAIDALALEQKAIREELQALANQKQASTAAAQAPQADGDAAPASDIIQRAAELEEKLQDLIELSKNAKNLVTRDEAMQLQDEVVQDAIIQIDARFAGIATQTDIERLQETFRKQIKEKIDSMRDLVFDALEGKIEEVKSLLDTDRIEHTIDGILRKKINPENPS